MNPNPIACASIAQVHVGKLEDGRVVAVKLKRPGVDRQLLDELEGIKNVVGLSQQFMGELSLLADWFGDFERCVADELDFTKEVSSLEFFQDIYRNSSDVRIPRVIRELSDRDKIIMEYLPSDPIKTCTEPRIVSENLMNMFVEQILYHGVIHGDLHAGNIGIFPGTSQIVVYDFGNVVQIPEFYQNAMRRVVNACQNRDANELLAAMTDMKMTIKDPKAAKKFASKFFVYLDTLDPKSFQYTKSDVMVPIELDTVTLTILRSHALVEGMCKEIYPQFTYEQVIQQNLEMLILERLFSL